MWCMTGMYTTWSSARKQRRTTRKAASLPGPSSAGTPTGCLPARCAWATWMCTQQSGVRACTYAGGHGVSLHGGPPGNPQHGLEQAGPFDQAVWTQLSPADSVFFTEADTHAYDACALFGIESPAGDQGYPGRLRVEAVAGVRGGARPCVHIGYRAKIMDNCALTPLNMTQHWGFNLAASHPASKGVSVDAHTLRIHPPSRHLVLDAKAVPTGEWAACDPSHDWSQGKEVRDRMPAQGYDDFYGWEEPVATPAVTLAAPGGPTLTFTTNQTGVQLYTANSLATPRYPRKALHRGELYDGVRSAAFLEFSAPHAAFLHPALHTQGDTLLRAGHVYDNWVHVEVLGNGPIP